MVGAVVSLLVSAVVAVFSLALQLGAALAGLALSAFRR